MGYKMVVKICILALLAITVAEKVSYSDYKVYQTIPTNTEQLDALKELSERIDYDFWSDPRAVNGDVRIMVSPAQMEEFHAYMKKYDITPELKIEDVQKIIEAQLIPTAHPSSQNEGRFRNTGAFNWERYHNYDEIVAWMDTLPELYPNNVRTMVMGHSNAGKEIKGVIIDFQPTYTGTDRLIGMLEGGIHSREWISPATLTWIINEFLTSTDPAVRSLAHTFQWHIFPIVNPDGYTYTFESNRMWRKNRNFNHTTACAPFGVSDDISNGIDLNRNFGYLWMSVGASQNPCAETYAGWAGFSEPESRAIANYVLMLKERGNVMYYISFHSYAQMLLVPYSHVEGADVLEAENYADMFEIGIRAMDALERRHGTKYETGTSLEILYAVSGSSFDWVKAEAHVPIVYLYELRDTNQYGFLLPTDQIIPNGEEVVDSLVEMHRVAQQIGYYTAAGSSISNHIMMLLAAVIVALRLGA